MSDIYQLLRERLDTMSTGFPATASGVELKLLKKLFSEEDAALFLGMGPLPETPEAVAARLSGDPEELARRLESMAGRGLLFRLRKGDSVRYSALPYVVGFMEHQVKRLDKDLARTMEDYYQAGFGRTLASAGTPLMRAVPVNKELAVEWPIAPYDDVLKFIDAQKSIMVADCICRKAARLNETGCDKPLESCFLFGAQGDFYVENGLGRHVTAEEAKSIVRRNLEAAPLVIQMANSQKGGGFCMCCGDCCGMLRSLKLQPRPALAAKSNYRAVIDANSCTSCGQCVERCQMGAIEETGGGFVVSADRCIGCGLCATGCPSEAARLERKAAGEDYTPPENFMYTYLEIAKERGKM